MIITWLQIEIQNGSGLPVAVGASGNVTIRNDSGHPVNILNGQSAGAPGVTNVSLAVTQSADVVRTPSKDLVVQVARYDFDDTVPVAQPGVILISIPIRAVLSTANLTQLWGATAGKPSFSVDANGVINTIGLV